MSSTALDRSRDRVLATAPAGEVVLAHATAIRAVGAWTLAPAHREPARHVEAAHAEARQHLACLERVEVCNAVDESNAASGATRAGALATQHVR